MGDYDGFPDVRPVEFGLEPCHGFSIPSNSVGDLQRPMMAVVRDAYKSIIIQTALEYDGRCVRIIGGIRRQVRP